MNTDSDHCGDPARHGPHPWMPKPPRVGTSRDCPGSVLPQDDETATVTVTERDTAPADPEPGYYDANPGAATADQVDAGPTIDIVVDGRTLDDAEVEALLQKPFEELTDAEREALQPLFEAALSGSQAQQPQGVDVMTVASDVLQDAVVSLMNKPANARRLEHKIALGHALAALVHAQAARHQVMLTQQQLQVVVSAQQQQQQAREHAKGPAGIVIPQASGIRL